MNGIFVFSNLTKLKVISKKALINNSINLINIREGKKQINKTKKNSKLNKILNVIFVVFV
jgi:hypothetical protein